MLGTIYSLIRRLKRSNFPGHGLINQMYYDPKTVILRLENLDYVAVDGCKFCVNDQIVSLQRVKGNPWFSGIRRTDTVLDIGANIGAIAIPLAKKAQHVYAVEPLFHQELWANIELNHLRNVSVFPYGVDSNAESRVFEFSSRCSRAKSIPFAELRSWIGHIDFLKVDCEGCEWGIEPEELQDIRELRIEFHIRRWHKKADWRKFREWERWLDCNGYSCVIQYSGEGGFKPGPCVPFSDCIMVNATLERHNK